MQTIVALDSMQTRCSSFACPAINEPRLITCHAVTLNFAQLVLELNLSSKSVLFA